MRNVLPVPKSADSEWTTFVVNLNRQLDDLEAALRLRAVGAAGSGHVVQNASLDLLQRGYLNFTGGVEASDAGGGVGSTKVQRSALTGVVVASAGSGTTTFGAAVTAFAQTVLAAASAAAARATLGAGTGDGTVTAVTGTSPIASSGGTTPAISIDPLKLAKAQAAQITTVTVNTTTTETTLLSGTIVGTLTLPAGFFVAGKVLRVVSRGLLSRVSNKLRFRLKLGATTVAQLDYGVNAVAANAALEFWVFCRTVGATGTVEVAGQIRVEDAGTFTEFVAHSAPASNVIDTTGTLALDLTLEPLTSDAGNGYACDMFIAERVPEP